MGQPTSIQSDLLCINLTVYGGMFGSVNIPGYASSKHLTEWYSHQYLIEITAGRHFDCHSVV